jgi:acetylornithine deacetylase/succinyl-diaminopimelate desuccinylase-like protein
MTTIDKYVKSREKIMLGELNDLLRIPSISTLSAHDGDCRKAAIWMRDHLKALGCKTSLLGDKRHPVVWGEGPKVKNAPTVLVYGHYDVQPPDPLDLWKTPPFEPTVRKGDLIARGATDDKGQVFSIVKAFETICRDGAPPVNVRFLIEGEEESGSEVLTDVLAREPERVEADAVLVADMPFFAKGWPAVYTALRGMVYTEIEVETLDGDLHSGLYGGVAPNAHETLVHILAKLKSPSGRIRIPGLYEAVSRPSRAERDDWSRLPFSNRKFMREEVGAKALTGLSRYSVFERLWALPTLDIHGIVGGFTDEGAKTVIPAVATAKVSLRLVPDQKAKTVERQLRAAVKGAAPSHARVTVRMIHGADPVQVDTDAAPVRLISEAFKEVIGRRAVAVRGGGSIPIIPILGQRGAPVVLAGIGLPDDRLHAPNEKIALSQFWTGVRVFARFFEMMGQKGS